MGHDDYPGLVRRANYQTKGQLAEDAAAGVALISVPIHFSGNEGHDYDFEIEKE
jgi:hypothetical protein